MRVGAAQWPVQPLSTHQQTHRSWPWQPALWVTGHIGWKHYLSMYICKWKSSYARPAHMQGLLTPSIFCEPQRALRLSQLTQPPSSVTSVAFLFLFWQRFLHFLASEDIFTHLHDGWIHLQKQAIFLRIYQCIIIENSYFLSRESSLFLNKVWNNTLVEQINV